MRYVITQTQLFILQFCSIVCIDPFLIPQTNTNSYYMNSKCSPCCPVEFLRWCWGAYLGLHSSCSSSFSNDDADDGNTGDENHKIDFHSTESYLQALKNCTWIQNDSKFARLITPQLDLPQNITTTGKNNIDNNSSLSTSFPTIIVTTSQGDPLYDDGIDLVSKLKGMNKGGQFINDATNVLHFEGKGSHTLSLLLNSDLKNRFIEAWNNAIWKE